MKKTSTLIEERNKILLLNLEKENIEELKRLSNELDTEEIALIKERYNEKKKLDQTEILVKDYLNELKKELKLNFDEDNLKERRISIGPPKIKNQLLGLNYLKFGKKQIYENKQKVEYNNNLLFKDNSGYNSKRSKQSKSSDKKSRNSISKGSIRKYHRKNTIEYSLKKKLNVSFEDNSNSKDILKRSSIKSYNLYLNNNDISHKNSKKLFHIKINNQEIKRARSDYFSFHLASALKRRTLEQKKKRFELPFSDNEKKEFNDYEEDDESYKRINKYNMSKTMGPLISNDDCNCCVSKKTFKTSHVNFDWSDEDLNCDSDFNNRKIIKESGISNDNILKLNDLKKEIKSSFIGEKPSKFIDSGKKFIFEDLGDDLNDSNENEKDIIYKEQRYRNLQKKSYVYDSFGDDEVFEDQMNIFYLNPDSKYVIFLDFFVCLCAFYNIIYIPYFLGSSEIYCKTNFWNKEILIGLFIDIIYILDSILPFFVAFYNFDEILKTDLKNIAKNYLDEWFILDLIAAIPIKTLLSLFDHKCKNFTFMINPLYHNNLNYLFCFIRIVKLYKVLCKNKFIEIISNFLSEIKHFGDYLKVYSNIITFLIALHIISNIFIFIGRNNYPNWIIYYNYQDKSYIELYLISIYYSIETLTTVGYGDIICTTVMEKIFGLFMEFIGIFSYSWIVTSMSNYVKNLHEKTEEYEKKCKILEKIRQSYNKLPDDLYEKIKRYLKYKQDLEKLDKKIVIESLPSGLSNLLIYEMYKPVIHNFIFFKSFDNIDFIVKVLLNFNPIIADKNEILIKEGDLVEDIIFVKRGRLSLELPLDFNISPIKDNTFNLENSNQNEVKIKKRRFRKFLQKFRRKKKKLKMFENEYVLPQNYKIIELRRNEHFGDILMFLNQRSPLNVRVKSKKAELFYLNKNHALDISSNFPIIWKKISTKSLFNFEQIKRYINKVKKIFYGSKNKPTLTKNKTRCSQGSEFSEYNDFNESELISIPSLSKLSDDYLENFTIEEKEEIKKQKTKKLKKKTKELRTIKEAGINESSYSSSSSKNKYIKSKFNNKISEKSEDEDNEKTNTYKNTNIENNNTINISDISNTYRHSSKSFIKNTPFHADDINLEIYPNEIFFNGCFNDQRNNRNFTKELKKRIQKDYNNYYSKNNKNDFNENSDFHHNEFNNLNLSICSTEISFSLNSEYNNINELSDYKYSKDIHLRERVYKILKEENLDEKESSLNNNSKYLSSNSNSESENSDYIKSKKNRKKTAKMLSTRGNKINNDLSNNFSLINNRKRRQSISFFQNNDKFSSMVKNNQEEKMSVFSQSKDNNISFKKHLSKKKKSLLRTLSKNIERNQINLNNPDLFYTNYFHSILDKKKEKNGENNLKKEEEEFMNKLEKKSTLHRLNSVNLFRHYDIKNQT